MHPGCIPKTPKNVSKSLLTSFPKDNKVSYVGGRDAWRAHIKDGVKINYNIKVDFKSITKLKSVSKLLCAMPALQ